MRLPIIFPLIFCSATLAWAADDRPAKSIPEAVDWLEVRVNAADDTMRRLGNSDCTEPPAQRPVH